MSPIEDLRTLQECSSERLDEGDGIRLTGRRSGRLALTFITIIALNLAAFGGSRSVSTSAWRSKRRTWCHSTTNRLGELVPSSTICYRQRILTGCQRKGIQYTERQKGHGKARRHCLGRGFCKRKSIRESLYGRGEDLRVIWSASPMRIPHLHFKGWNALECPDGDDIVMPAETRTL